MSDQVRDIEAGMERGRAGEVFWAFLKLGLTSFGGPVAHLGYFREELVVRRRWLADSTYADLVALCQFLPGPSSSQVGFVLGLMRAGWAGALAAFIAFTLPSALILLIFAASAAAIDGPLSAGALHGLKIVAVAIVAQAVFGMARQLCPDRTHATIAVMAVAMLALVPATGGMVAAIMMGALAGMIFCRVETKQASRQLTQPVTQPVSQMAGIIAFAVFVALLGLLPILAQQSQTLAVLDGFYRAGALVFGGGHVVLPLLDAQVVQTGWVSPDEFIAGYGVAQALPGPLFSFAAYLGAVLGPQPNGMEGAGLALLAIFLPGFLLLIAILPFWDRFRMALWAQALMSGANASVVGILGAALYSPVFTSAIADMRDLAVALAAFVALTVWRIAPWVVVIMTALAGIGLVLID